MISLSSFCYLKIIRLDVSRNCTAPLTAYHALKENTHGEKQTVEFRQEVVRVALTSGLSCEQVVSALRLNTVGQLVSAPHWGKIRPVRRGVSPVART